MVTQVTESPFVSTEGLFIYSMKVNFHQQNHHFVRPCIVFVDMGQTSTN